MLLQDEDVSLIIARYREDISWANGVPRGIKTIVYDKNRKNPVVSNLKIERIKNFGRESQTYLHHILNHYDDLSDWTLFTQGNPFDHSKHFMHLFHEDIDKSKNISLRQNGYYGISDCLFELNEEKQFNVDKKDEADWFTVVCCSADEIYEIIKMNRPTTHKHNPGAIMLVSKSMILKHPRETYQKLHDLHFRKYTWHTPWSFEICWPSIFSKREIKFA